MAHMHRNQEGRILIKGLTLKEWASIAFLLTLVLGIPGNAIYQNHLANAKKYERIVVLEAEVATYESKISTCTDTTSVFPSFYGDNPRSSERITRVVKTFQSISEWNCLIFQKDKIYDNPYRGLSLSNLGAEPRGELEEEVFQGIIFEIDKGIPYLVTGGSICSDGSISGSVGRGTCSWHGGYARQRGYRFEFKQAEPVYDPRIELAQITRE